MYFQLPNYQKIFFQENQDFTKRKSVTYKKAIDILSIASKSSYLGYGVGEISSALSFSQYNGFDLDADRIDICKLNNKNIKYSFYCGDLIAHSFNKTYDVIISISPLYEIRNKADYPSKILNLINENSKFYLMVIN